MKGKVQSLFWGLILLINLVASLVWYWVPLTLPEGVTRGDAAIVWAVWVVGFVLWTTREST